MITFDNKLSVYLHREPIDFRKQINGLSILVQDAMLLDLFTESCFVFVNRQRNRIKILYWQRNGFCLWMKRLEKDQFSWPKHLKEDVVSLTVEELHWLLDGFDIWRKPSHCRRKYFWVTVGGPPDKQVYRYHYNPSRGSAVAQDLLSGFKGAVMTDDWSVYGKVCETLQLTHIACNDHARRRFNDAVKALPKKRKTPGISQAEMGLNYYQKLYAIERRIKDLTIEEKLRIRQKDSLPIWEKFIAWIEKAITKVTPSSDLGKALHYTYKLRDKLSYYCHDGALPISNEKAENAIRPFAIARKNFLFYDSPKGAEASANLYSLIITAKQHGLNPFYYLAYVFKHLPLAKTVEDIEALLPWSVDNHVTKTAYQLG